MLTFETGLDIRAREASKPTIARFNMGNGIYKYCIVGTDYGHIHISSGDVRVWGSYQGAYKFIKTNLTIEEA